MLPQVDEEVTMPLDTTLGFGYTPSTLCNHSNGFIITIPSLATVISYTIKDKTSGQGYLTAPQGQLVLFPTGE